MYYGSVKEGEQPANELGIPFVNGEMSPDERLETIRENKASLFIVPVMRDSSPRTSTGRSSTITWINPDVKRFSVQGI